MSTKILLSSPHLSGNEQKYIKEAFDSNWVAPIGPNVNEFEKNLQDYIGQNKYAVALNSGTSALHLALILAGVKQNDEVICQSFTFSASANPILYQNAIPVFVDSEKDTWNICPKILEEVIMDRISFGKKPKAIIVVHLYGMPAKMLEIKEIANKYEILLIEDAAEALGSSINGQMCGTFGDFSIFSFNGNKIITTSGGGALICATEKEKERAIFYATQSRDIAPHYQHSKVGYNFRMSNILAGIGRGQMEIVTERIKARRTNFEFYREELIGINNIQFLMEPEGFYSNRWLTCILTPSNKSRERLRLALEKQNIESRPLWKPMHLQPIFKKFHANVNGISEKLFEQGLCLPSGSNLSKKELLKVVNCIKEQEL